VDADDKARKYVKDETRDAQILIATAETAIGSGDSPKPSRRSIKPPAENAAGHFDMCLNAV